MRAPSPLVLFPYAVAWVLATAAAVYAQSAPVVPHVGYVYPAGGQLGKTVEITLGGEYLRGVSAAIVSGQGVEATVIEHYKPVRTLDRDQRLELIRQLREVLERRQAEAAGKPLPPATVSPLAVPTAPKASPASTGSTGSTASTASVAPPSARAPGARLPAEAGGEAQKPTALPEHPLLHNLQDKSVRELQNIAGILLSDFKKKQQNMQIGEMVLVQVHIAPDAVPGDREIRLLTPVGLTNPIRFQVGQLPEVLEMETPRQPIPGFTAEDEPVALPATFNGQILPGDSDRFRFQARKGQHLVMQVAARHLIPFLADAVPGWFQPVLALYDASGKELAFADDYRFDPDPVLYFEVPADGEYQLEIRDALYRGREDFVYRIAVGELPFVTQAFPLGGQAGTPVVARVAGWNLTTDRAPLDTRPGDDPIRQAVTRQGQWLANGVAYAVDSLPESNETEPNETAASAQRIALPRIVNGRIDHPGDIDEFRFAGHAGDDIVAEIMARRLGSPLDSVLRLTDPAGKVLAWNDDNVRKQGYLYEEEGLLTHDADSYVRAKLPQDGDYLVQVSDAQHQGGEGYAYRLRLGPPRPDFALRATPSSLNLIAGSATPISVYALRQDGFAGDIEIALRDAPAGFSLTGAKIPAGRDSVRMTLSAPRQAPDAPFVLKLEGRAVIGGEKVTRAVAPAEDMMQAFLYRHLAPSQDLLVDVPKTRFALPPFTVQGPVRVPEGGSVEVQLRTMRYPKLADLRLELSDPPAGLTMGEATVVPEGLAFQLKVDPGSKTLQAGFADNLIVEVFTDLTGRQGAGQPAAGQAPPARAGAQRQRVSLGVLPAIPFEVVKQ